MSEDIVTRLRYPIVRDPEDLAANYAICRLLLNDAANEIERLRKELVGECEAEKEVLELVAEIAQLREELSQCQMDLGVRKRDAVETYGIPLP